jgi:hypothetical protein
MHFHDVAFASAARTVLAAMRIAICIVIPAKRSASRDRKKK